MAFFPLGNMASSLSMYINLASKGDVSPNLFNVIESKYLEHWTLYKTIIINKHDFDIIFYVGPGYNKRPTNFNHLYFEYTIKTEEPEQPSHIHNFSRVRTHGLIDPIHINLEHI